MDSVLVLIAAPGSQAIDRGVVELLQALGADAPHWLAQGEAAEVPFFPRIAEFFVAMKERPVDLALVSTDNRKKRILIADMDSTMIRQECIDELGAAAGLGERIKAITARAMRGELDFDQALRERVGLLKDLDAAIIDEIIRERITYMPGGRALIATMRSRGAYTALVSGGFRQFTARVAAHLGFDENQANDLIIADGKLAGTVGLPILGEQAKVEALRRICGQRGLDTEDAIAVGDGANDVAMLTEAGMGVALHAKPHVQDSSLIRINHGDLTALLYLQGYRVQDFVAI
jgi:phosphoserine phosphatase